MNAGELTREYIHAGIVAAKANELLIRQQRQINEMREALDALCESFELRVADDENAEWTPSYSRARAILAKYPKG